MEMKSLLARAVIAADVIVAEMITNFFPVNLQETLIDICERQTQKENYNLLFR